MCEGGLLLLMVMGKGVGRINVGPWLWEQSSKECGGLPRVFPHPSPSPPLIPLILIFPLSEFNIKYKYKIIGFPFFIFLGLFGLFLALFPDKKFSFPWIIIIIIYRNNSRGHPIWAYKFYWSICIVNTIKGNNTNQGH
jgi:hypothetical protein